MKKILLVACIIAVILPVSVAVYAQPPQETAISSQLGTFNTPHVTNMQPDKRPTIFTSSFLNTPAAENAGYGDTPVNKAGEGVINTTTCWTDIPREVNKTSEEDNLLAGLTLGLGKGIVSTFARGASGIVDALTCGLPPYDEPLMKPEYKVNHPEQGFQVDILRW